MTVTKAEASADSDSGKVKGESEAESVLGQAIATVHWSKRSLPSDETTAGFKTLDWG